MILVEVEGVWEANDSSKGPHGDPEGFLFLENPFVVGCEIGGSICGGEWAKLVASVFCEQGSVVSSVGDDVCVNWCEW